MIQSFGGKSSPQATSAGRRAKRPRARPRAKKEDGSEESEPKSTEERKKPSLLDVARGLSDKLNPINFSYSRGRSGSQPGIEGHPPLRYRLGFSRDPGNPSHPAIVSLPSSNESDTYTTRSGINISRNVSTTMSYALSKTVNIRSANDITETTSRDFLPLGETGENGIPFFTWTLRWSGLERLPIFSTLAQSVSLDHGFSGKENLALRKVRDEGITTTDTTSLSNTAAFQPLIGINMIFKHNLTANIRYSRSKSVAKQFAPAGARLTTTSNISVTMNHTRRSGLHLPIFFFRDFDLDNTVNFSLTYDRALNETRTRNTDFGSFAISSLSRSWKVVPQISYSFSSKVTGGIFFEFGKNESLRSGETTFTDFGLDVNIAIRG